MKNIVALSIDVEVRLHEAAIKVSIL